MRKALISLAVVGGILGTAITASAATSYYIDGMKNQQAAIQVQIDQQYTKEMSQAEQAIYHSSVGYATMKMDDVQKQSQQYLQQKIGQFENDKTTANEAAIDQYSKQALQELEQHIDQLVSNPKLLVPKG